MPRPITYRILDEADGRFGVVATLDPHRVYRRGGLATLAEAEDWVEGLRALMAACGAPVVRADGGVASAVLSPERGSAAADRVGASKANP